MLATLILVATLGVIVGSALVAAYPAASASPWRLEQTDDGATVDLDSVSGGAAPEGAWGALTVRFTAPDGTQTLRKYTAGPAVRADLHQEATRT